MILRMVTEHTYAYLCSCHFLKLFHIYMYSVHVCSLGIEHNYVYTQTNTSLSGEYILIVYIFFIHFHLIKQIHFNCLVTQ